MRHHSSLASICLLASGCHWIDSQPSHSSVVRCIGLCLVCGHVWNLAVTFWNSEGSLSPNSCFFSTGSFGLLIGKLHGRSDWGTGIFFSRGLLGGWGLGVLESRIFLSLPSFEHSGWISEAVFGGWLMQSYRNPGRTYRGWGSCRASRLGCCHLWTAGFCWCLVIRASFR